MEEIPIGAVWPERLIRALKRSKVLMCIWSPDYFRSGHCTAEWRTFRSREMLLRQRLAEEYKQRGNSGELSPIAPLVFAARYHDGNSFPIEARMTQSDDFSSFASLNPAFLDHSSCARLRG